METWMKNMLRGAIFTAVYIVTTIVIPFLTFSWIRTLTVNGKELEIYKDTWQQILFWIVAFGLVISGSAFFAYSSPKQSIRRGIFSLIQIILNCFYLWSYKFSGALEVELTLVDIGMIYVNLQQLILLYLGIYFLTVILKIYDLVDFVINREKIRMDRSLG
ncbi:MAG: hypothetical protein GF383_04325 [Candidatus Lokiarchaeota archaeon]|nr:hypothetical protein [Candidatus Lokiarchaeota archaeon]MBD3338986.1 hypothetical protein [Candidatus Lokiarchaeota archaeon]